METETAGVGVGGTTVLFFLSGLTSARILILKG